MRHVWVRAMALGGALLGSATRADAADVAVEVRALFVKANALYEAGHAAEAEVLFEQAWALRPAYDLAINLGQSETAQEKWLEALPHLRYGVDHVPAGISSKRRRQFEELYALALSKVALLKVLVEPSDALVEVDGLPTAMLPEGLAVEPGERRITVTKASFVTSATRVTVGAGERKEVKVTLTAQAPAAPGPSAPAVPAQPPSQAPKVVDSEERSWVLPMVTGGAGIVFLGAAVGFTLASNSADQEREAERARLVTLRVRCTDGAPACAALDEAANDRDTFHTAAAWLYVGAGVAAGVTAALVFWPEDGAKPDAANAKVQVVPSVGPKQAGLVWMGRF